MATHRLRLVLKWIGGFLAWYVYSGVVLFTMNIVWTGPHFFLVVLFLTTAPLIVLLAFWVHVESPAEIKRKAAMQFKAILRR